MHILYISLAVVVSICLVQFAKHLLYNDPLFVRI